MTDLSEIAASLHPLERKILPFLSDCASLEELQEKAGLSEVEVMRALQWLQNKRALEIKTETTAVIALDANGIRYKEKGLPERRFLQALDSGPLAFERIKKLAGLDNDEITIAIGVLKNKGLIRLGKEIALTDSGKRYIDSQSIEEQFIYSLPLYVSDLSPEQGYAYNEFTKRRRIIKTDLKKIRTFTLTLLGQGLVSMPVENNYLEALTTEVLKSGSWKKTPFRHYDLKSIVPRIYPGKKHPINQAIDVVRRIWLDMGFREMHGSIIQTSFWNFDALFVPQDHPARDMQDTLFLKNPEKGSLPEKDIVEKVSKTHENGWNTGSRGWRYDWQEKEAKLNVLRTHTTVLSAQTISKLKNLPGKFFSIGKVFRNEALDWAHLFEFYQSEGIVVDENVSFKHLLGYLKEFFRKIGFEKVRFRPGYFGYTEPSVEIDVFHPTQKKWIELGGAGIFRPEVVIPLFGKDVPVLAWGLGVERIISMYYGLNDIRDLYKNDIKSLREFKLFLPRDKSI